MYAADSMYISGGTGRMDSGITTKILTEYVNVKKKLLIEKRNFLNPIGRKYPFGQ